MGAAGILNAKASMALKSHSEAERRRRERINGHLAMLRSIVPCTDKSLQLKAVPAEISTLGGRIKNVFVMTCEGNPSDMEHHLFTTNVEQALKSVHDRATSIEYVPRTYFVGKRRRISPLNPRACLHD